MSIIEETDIIENNNLDINSNTQYCVCGNKLLTEYELTEGECSDCTDMYIREDVPMPLNFED